MTASIAQSTAIESRLGDGASSRSTIGATTLATIGEPSPCAYGYSPFPSANGYSKLSTISKLMHLECTCTCNS
jgi:hypothetical protein